MTAPRQSVCWSAAVGLLVSGNTATLAQSLELRQFNGDILVCCCLFLHGEHGHATLSVGAVCWHGEHGHATRKWDEEYPPSAPPRPVPPPKIDGAAPVMHCGPRGFGAAAGCHGKPGRCLGRCVRVFFFSGSGRLAAMISPLSGGPASLP